MDPELSDAETHAAEALLAGAWGERAEVDTAEPLGGRNNVFRLYLGTGRSAVLKRRGHGERDPRSRSFGVELAALEYLNGMPEPVAPRLLGADMGAGIFLMEDLGAGSTLAGALLAGGREQAQAGLVAYARALAALHAWSTGRPGSLADLRARYAPGAPARPGRLGIAEGQKHLLDVAATLGLPAGGVADEIDGLGSTLDQTGHAGLVHADACPDNVRLADGTCRIFDFEHSGWGCAAVDVANLVAPFPTCWCFASVPGDVADPALAAYRERLRDAGIELGADWDTAMTAALAALVVSGGPRIAAALSEDPRWGTTTMRPRLLAWLRSFIGQASGSGALPRLRDFAEALHDQLALRWPEAAVPDYPALARPGSRLAHVDDAWLDDL
jgi:Ser/Thr protein kinase RdoA (MazF antagonist)